MDSSNWMMIKIAIYGMALMAIFGFFFFMQDKTHQMQMGQQKKIVKQQQLKIEELQKKETELTAQLKQLQQGVATQPTQPLPLAPLTEPIREPAASQPREPEASQPKENQP